MTHEIVIDAGPLEVRAALLEERKLVEFHLERGGARGLAGNIYKGKVTRVLPGMQAAFVEIGLEKAGFLHASDFLDEAGMIGSVAQELGEEDVETESARQPTAIESQLADDDGAGGAGAPAQAEGGGRRRRARRGRSRSRGHSHLPIEQQLRRGQEIIVQISKEPIGTKGARLTSAISLPGRHLVYMPGSSNLGISRRIESADERARLRDAVNEIRPAQGGFIVRTACEGVSKREIQHDITFLTRLWASVVKKAETSKPETLLYSDLDLPLRLVRDLFSSEIDRLWCDDPETFDRIAAFVQNYMPRLRSRLTRYEGDAPIFEHFKIEQQIEQALERKVWLKSGGYLVFDQAEALTAIDVNTGRFVGKKSHAETVLKTNLEALDEVVRQLRLRNLGGIIIVDFIDMDKEGDRKRVSDALEQALKKDKARATALKISELGLVQMTRKRTRESLQEMLTEPCERCHGRGVVKSVAAWAAEALRAIRAEARGQRGAGMIVVKVNPEVLRYLYDAGAQALEAIERRFEVKIAMRPKDSVERGAIEVGQAPAAA